MGLIRPRAQLAACILAVALSAMAATRPAPGADKQPATRAEARSDPAQPAPTAATTHTFPPPTTQPVRIVAEGWLPVREVPRPELPPQVARAYVIPIHGPISRTTADVVQRKVVRCKTGGAQIVIFDMDTPGGASDAMEDIVRLILEELAGVYTVAYVHPQAYSAGAIISLACNEIVMSPTGVIGDAMPIMIGPGGIVEIPEKERGKVESAMRAEVRKLAERNGYDELLCQSMITITLEVWMIRDSATGEMKFVEAGKWRDKVAGAPPSTQPGGASPPATAQWEYVSTIVGPNELLTMTATEAVHLGFAKHLFASLDDLKKHYSIVAETVALEDNWSEGLVAFLTSPAVTGILFFIAVLGLYMEFNAPGHILPGAVAVLCLAIIFGSRYLIGLAQWWEIAAFGLGVILVLVELLVIPGHGMAGILGVGLCIVSLAAMLIPSAPDKLPIPSTPLEWKMFTDGALGMGIGLVAAAIAAWILASYLPKVPVAGKLVLPPAQPGGGPPVTPTSPLLVIRAGDVGIVESMCRPVGRVRFGEALLDAASEGDIIEPGARVRVLRRDGSQVVVERLA